MAKSPNSSKAFSWLFWLLMLMLPLFRLKALQDETLVSRYLLLGVFALGVLLLDRKILKSTFPRLISILLILFGLLQLISLSWAYNPSESWGVAARVFAFSPYFFILYYQIKEAQFAWHDLLKGLLIFAMAAALPAAYYLLKAMGSGDFFDDIYQITGTFGHKNLLASALMLSFPFVLASWALLKGVWSRVAMLMALLMLIEMFVLRTRGVWLALFGAAVFSALVLQFKKPVDIKIPRKWLFIFSGGALLILLALFLSPQIKAGFTNSSNVQKRLAFWENSMEMIKEHPVTGVGAGNWKIIFPKYGLAKVDHSTMQGITHIQRPHNDFLWLWAETGPLGLILYLGLFVLTLFQLLRNLGAGLNKEQQIVNLAALFGLVSLAVFSFSDFPLERASHSFFLMLILAIAWASAPKAKEQGYLAYALVPMLALSIFVNYQRYQGESKIDLVMKANADQNPKSLIKATEAAFDAQWYTLDNYANPLPYYSGKAYMFTDRLPQAKVDLDMARNFAPYNILVLEAFTQYYARQGEDNRALALADSVLEISPHFEMLLLMKAEIHLKRKEYPDALGTLNMYPPTSNNERYMQDLAQALRGSLETYPQHGRYAPMMEHLKQSGQLVNPVDYVRAYRQKRGLLN
ncbi:O-antigen ligase family protein [Croceimicrobium sp.]|uniref:O-antigen ligase family protein n=1 Tax=Croceimicrobium sp. TaxID=2828340 RepID=UPI003BAB8F4D